jgi:hypothetical protein
MHLPVQEFCVLFDCSDGKTMLLDEKVGPSDNFLIVEQGQPKFFSFFFFTRTTLRFAYQLPHTFSALQLPYTAW